MKKMILFIIFLIYFTLLLGYFDTEYSLIDSISYER